MPVTDLVLESLMLAAETGEDVTEPVNAAFQAMEPAAADLMDHMDEHMRGRMMQELLTVLMADDPQDQREYLNFEVSSHRGYGVTTPMYGALLAALRDCVRGLLGDEWTPAHLEAWDERIRSLEEIIENAARAPADA
jgi:hemoglobin-like flavoprotein